MAEKQRLIRNHPILIEAVGQYAAGVSGAEDDRGAYRLIGGDLRDMSTVASALEREGLMQRSRRSFCASASSRTSTATGRFCDSLGPRDFWMSSSCAMMWSRPQKPSPR